MAEGDGDEPAHFTVLAPLNLNLRLKIGETYSREALMERCGGNAAKRQKLEEHMADGSTTLQRVRATQATGLQPIEDQAAKRRRVDFPSSAGVRFQVDQVVWHISGETRKPARVLSFSSGRSGSISCRLSYDWWDSTQAQQFVWADSSTLVAANSKEIDELYDIRKADRQSRAETSAGDQHDGELGTTVAGGEGVDGGATTTATTTSEPPSPLSAHSSRMGDMPRAPDPQYEPGHPVWVWRSHGMPVWPARVQQRPPEGSKYYAVELLSCKGWTPDDRKLNVHVD
eukprot:CAMPEP_0178382450 /NCGR_PEP_ID=MMETSP0689_2-20121128/6498_1 /TAXON_ID=160604 /ORGANISM="Amphidinium massartii, Strain CS-259" /LENGTH=284 /DNA_ID=CAMNT_0020002651 /DNA_START=65 /DNA_END=916 /DNA_ORIENTATION=+